MPTRIHTVVVFGDSLSDIGKKWVTKSGRMARLTNQMYVSPTGRFSDCRNWTDFMYEEASGASLIVASKDESYENSQKHMTLTSQSTVHAGTAAFGYVNYAEGGACGDVPREKAPFLGTFKEQVDAFEKDCNAAASLGNTLFIIWFGANDLYTANRPAVEMGQVAREVADTQRRRLRALVATKGQACKFIFVNLARPLTSVRYSMRLDAARQKLKSAVALKMAKPGASIPMGGADHWKQIAGPSSSRFFKGAKWSMDTAIDANWAEKEVRELVEQVNAVKELEKGVMFFNVELSKIAGMNGDRVAEIGSCITEAAIQTLVSGNYGLKAGAASTTAVHMSAQAYTQRNAVTNMTTIDGVHPTDQMYRLIWKEIYEEIKKADCTFGTLVGVAAPSTLSTLAGPTQQTKANFNRVLGQLPRKVD